MPILAATDTSERADAALRTAARWARVRDSSLTVLHCIESGADAAPWAHLLEDPQNQRGRFWKAAMEQLEERFHEAVAAGHRPRDVEFRVEFEFAADGILEVLEEGDYELGVLGATSAGRVEDFFLGSTPERVVRRSDTPILTVPAQTGADGYERILAPVDFTACSRESLDYAAERAREHRAELIVVHAYDLPVGEAPFVPSHVTPDLLEDYEQQRTSKLQSFVDELVLEDVDTRQHLAAGEPTAVIVDAVETFDADLVVMGTHGRRGFQRLFLGSTATKVLRRMPAPVLTVRSRDGTEAE